MGIRDKPTAPASPWQNGFAERLIGSIRRECLDHIIVLGEAHLRRILKSYADYYNGVRTHRSLNEDAPVSRQIQRTGSIKSHAVLGGLHHHYVRVWAFGTHRHTHCRFWFVVFGERHLRHVLFSYMNYYNAVRTHLALCKDAPVHRRIQRFGTIEAQPVLGGLHHQYVRKVLR